MECKKIHKQFRLAGMKGNGAYADFGTDVPKAAQNLMARADEIEHRAGKEIAIFEPKRGERHLEGSYYVGMIVNQPLSEVPNGMEFIELNGEYAMARGNIKEVGSLHNGLMKWAVDMGYKQNMDAYIVETYHPLENGEEEIEVYLPILG